MSKLYLIRHGITPANRENRFGGRTGEELNAEGIEQMWQVGERLEDKKIAAIYCSPTKRTVQSAEILGSLLHIPITPLAEFDEIYIPHWDGLTKDEIRKQYDAQYPTWLSMPQTFKLPGCETLKQVQDRAVAAVERLLPTAQNQDLLVVSHLIVLRCLVLYFRGLAIRDFRTISIQNGAIIEIAGFVKNRRSVRSL